MAMELRTRQVGPWLMNTYALVCPKTRQSVLFDPGDDPDTLSEMLAGTLPVAILLTHTHPDHIGALSEMRRRLGVPLGAFDGPHLNGLTLAEEILLRDDNLFTVGKHTLRVYSTPGHIPDQICFLVDGDNKAIVGDTLFDGGPGKTWSAAGFRQTLDSLHIVLGWPNDIVCYPGHGPHFRLGDRRAQIETFVERDHGDFFGDATWD
ncbi:MAG TPA: MBL fold metallo-hydrolase [Promineifilum sp.]|nr:MBL fold metallo-hydrolase [Promineifilum sp.]HRO90467.1 MBL fold metallo-hydrolase [Promineifilum sp.]HRQ14692.1 MBL fold metallo-hydrolase [Promineifilum sp.]